MAIHVKLRGDEAWPDLIERFPPDYEPPNDVHIAVLESGMQSGLPSVFFRIDGEHGTALAQVSLREFYAAVVAINARYPKAVVVPGSPVIA